MFDIVDMIFDINVEFFSFIIYVVKYYFIVCKKCYFLQFKFKFIKNGFVDFNI